MGNKRMIFLLSVLAFMGFVSTAVAAQESLSLQETVREAAWNNPDLAAAQEAVQKAQAQYRGSYSPLLPQVSANASYTKSKSTVGLKDYVADLSAKQSLFSGLKNESGVQKAKADLETSEENLAVVKSRVSFDLKNAYAQLLFAQQQAELSEVIASRRQENVQLIELSFEGGSEPKGSFLRSRALYHQADFEVSQAERALKVAQRQLARVLGRSESEKIFVEDLQVGSPGIAPDFRSVALKIPVCLQAAAQARSAQAGIGVARSELLPDVSAFGSLGRQGSQFPPRQDEWTAGIVFSYPFWPGGQNIFDFQAAKAEARRTQQVLRSTEDQTVVGLEQTFAGFQDTVQRVIIQREFVAAATVRAEIARGQYKLGLISFQDWDTIENDLISNQKTILVNLRDAIAAEAAWEQAQGKGYIP